MRFLILSILVCTASAASAAWVRYVDVGFRNYDKHIAIVLTEVNGELAYGFKLTSNVSGTSVAITGCVYGERALKRELAAIQDERVRGDFRWIFNRSDYSATPIEQFYPEFRALLRRADPACDVPELQLLTDRLDVSKG